MKVTALGDQGHIVYCNDEASALAYARTMRDRNLPWVIDIVPAYTSVGVLCDLNRITLEQAEAELASHVFDTSRLEPSRTHVVPCCYDVGLDWDRVTAHTKLSVEEVIHLHTSQEFTVYAIGFCPGFPYLGYLPPALSGVPRLESPRVRVEAGSVGLTGRQTGIYTEARPGGWNLIGRTPLKLVDMATEYFPLRAGDRVRFTRIDKHEFARGQA